MKNMVIINKFLLYGPMIPKPIWALEHGSIVWPKGPTSVSPRIPVQTHKNYKPKLRVIQET